MNFEYTGRKAHSIPVRRLFLHIHMCVISNEITINGIYIDWVSLLEKDWIKFSPYSDIKVKYQQILTFCVAYIFVFFVISSANAMFVVHLFPIYHSIIIK